MLLIYFRKYGVLTVVPVKIPIFWRMTPCRLVYRWQCFEGICCMQKYHLNRCSKLLLNFYMNIPYQFKLHNISEEYKRLLCYTSILPLNNFRLSVAVCTWDVPRPPNIYGHLSSCDCPAMKPAAERRRQLKEAWRCEDVQVLTESVFAGRSEEHVCARGVGVQGLEDAVHITAAIIHGQKREVDIWWEPVFVNDVLTGSLQHWQDLGQRHLVAVVLWQNYCSSDVAVCVGITDVAHELQNIYNKVTEGRFVDVCAVGTLSTAVLLRVTPACVNTLKTLTKRK